MSGKMAFGEIVVSLRSMPSDSEDPIVACDPDERGTRRCSPDALLCGTSRVDRFLFVKGKLYDFETGDVRE
jgi:hypothetical protein